MEDVTIPSPGTLRAQQTVGKALYSDDETRLIQTSFSVFASIFQAYLSAYSENAEVPLGQELRYKILSAFNTFIVRPAAKLPITSSSVSKLYFANVQLLIDQVWGFSHPELLQASLLQYFDLLLKLTRNMATYDSFKSEYSVKEEDSESSSHISAVQGEEHK